MVCGAAAGGGGGRCGTRTIMCVCVCVCTQKVHINIAIFCAHIKRHSVCMPSQNIAQLCIHYYTNVIV